MMMKAYPAYKESGDFWFGKIPEHWQFLSYRHLVTKVSNGTTSRQMADETNCLVSRIETISTGKINFDKVGFLDEAAADSRYLLNSGDLLLSHINSLDYVGNCAYYEGERPLFHGMNLLRLEANEEFISPKFHYYLIKNYQFKKRIQAKSKHAINQVSLSISSLKSIRVSLPPLPEQKAIADFLDRKTKQIDTLIEKKRRQIALLEEQRTALINQAVTKGLWGLGGAGDATHLEGASHLKPRMKDSGIEWLGEIPRHWEVSTVRYFFDVKLGKMLDSSKQAQYSIVKPYLRAANIHWNEILLDEVGVNEMGFTEEQLDRYRLEKGDLLVTEGGVTVGRSAIWNEKLPECYYQNSLNRARSLKSISTKWLYYWMYFVTNNGFIDILADKSTFGHLTNAKLKALPVLIPPEDEHLAIIEKLEDFEPKTDAQIELIQKSIKLLQEYRTALISAAVTGKVDVREDEQGGAHL